MPSCWFSFSIRWYISVRSLLGKAGNRLVQKQHFPGSAEGARQQDALLLTAGKLVGQVFELIAQTHPLKGSFCRRVALCGGDARIHKGNFHVLQKCQLRKQVVLLEDEAQLLVPDVCQLTALILPTSLPSSR